MINGQDRLSSDSSSPAGAAGARPEPQLRARIDVALATVAAILAALWLLFGSAVER